MSHGSEEKTEKSYNLMYTTMDLSQTGLFLGVGSYAFESIGSIFNSNLFSG